ncbi:hypothetical protein GYMLUDRAFT_180270 [Collybiopsis luxurians FD-317 M1]|uniref:RNase H type-1 domain-containing protein n=1 Tax=Collybiopsis luxurians FD-317 M1 TaxID=944289 RepID=A0A0D0C3B5_9AGAR|nr:hypothetical protein GYMLUDRAFT_180270 [Collybiopsis luxurians FD-317 M1]
MAKLIFYWEALTMLSALIWLTSQNGCRGFECKPFQLTFCSDSSNTVDMFSSLSALPNYSLILLAAVNIMVQFHIDLRVMHIAGSENTTADALSRFDFDSVWSAHLDITLHTIQPPQLSLGVSKK